MKQNRIYAINPGLLASALFTLSSMAVADDAKTLGEAIKGASTSGTLRFGYISNDPDVAGSTDDSAAAVGGVIKLETAPWNRLQFAIAPYFSEKLESLSGDEDQGKLNGDFFNANGDSFAYLGEAYVTYTWSNGVLRYGRQLLDNPFINTDDIRMLPNSFDAVWATVDLGSSVQVEAGRVQRWAGFDSGADQDKFKDVGEDGVTALGVHYNYGEEQGAHAWYYDFDQSYSVVYADASYGFGELEVAAQYASFSEDAASGIDGTAWGLSASYSFGQLALLAAVNETSNDAGKAIDLGLGGGSFFTSMDETTIGGLTDASAYLIALEYAVNDAFSVALAQGHFEDDAKASADINELNVILTYVMGDELEAQFTHTTVENDAAPADGGTNFTRQLLRVGYFF